MTEIVMKWKQDVFMMLKACFTVQLVQITVVTIVLW